MKEVIDLNVAPIEMYPVAKILTRSDMTTSQLVLPRHGVEDHIILNMEEVLRDRLVNKDRRANVWVVDDEMRKEYFLTIVDRDHRYSIISWSHVLQNRILKVGQKLRFGWMLGKLHFIVMPDDVKKPGEGTSKDLATNEVKGDKRNSHATKNMKQSFGDALLKRNGLHVFKLHCLHLIFSQFNGPFKVVTVLL